MLNVLSQMRNPSVMFSSGIVNKPVRFIVIYFLPLFLSACSVPETTPQDRWRHAADGAFAADISANGELAVLSGVNNGVNVWRIGEEAPLFNWRHQGEGNNLVTTLHISADSQYVVTSDREAFALWSISTGEPIGFWRVDESTVRDIAVANGGVGLLVGQSSGKIMYFEPESSRRIDFLGHTEKINSIDISPNGKFALTGGNDYLAYLWSTDTGQVIYTFKHSSRVTKVAIDDQGRYLFTAGSNRESKIWNAQNGQMVSNLSYTARQKIFTEAVFSKDGKYLLTGSPSRRMNLWLVETGEEVAEWKVAPRESSVPKTSVVYGVGFAKDGAILSASSAGLTARWEPVKS